MSGPEADGKLEFRVPGKRACKRPNRNDNGGGGGVCSPKTHPTPHPIPMLVLKFPSFFLTSDDPSDVAQEIAYPTSGAKQPSTQHQ